MLIPPLPPPPPSDCARMPLEPTASVSGSSSNQGLLIDPSYSTATLPIALPPPPPKPPMPTDATVLLLSELMDSPPLIFRPPLPPLPPTLWATIALEREPSVRISPSTSTEATIPPLAALTEPESPPSPPKPPMPTLNAPPDSSV